MQWVRTVRLARDVKDSQEVARALAGMCDGAGSAGEVGAKYNSDVKAIDEMPMLSRHTFVHVLCQMAGQARHSHLGE
jgi:hypothetical protein